MADTDSVIQSRVLVGRDDFVSLAARRLAEAAAGRGQLLFVAGEAGIGKTRLLTAVATHAENINFTVVRAAAFPGDAHSFGGLLDDLAGRLGADPDPAVRAFGDLLAERVRASAATDGDAHYRRRVRVGDLVDALAAIPSERPTLIILEDLHWADSLSLDVLARAIGRLATRPVLIAGAYRSNELFDDVPLRDVRTRLLTQRLAEEIRLTRLDPAQTADVIAAIIGRPAPAGFAAAVHERSDGIPLHIEELLATIDPDRLSSSSGTVVATAAVPETLGDAIRERARRQSPTTRDVAAAAAVIGRSFDFDLLVTVTGIDPDAVANALRELQEAYVVGPGADAVTFDFRHALIRDTLYADTDLPRRRRLHERVAEAASRSDRAAFASGHYELAGRAPEAYRHAIVAARAAAAMSAHTEALGLYRRAVRSLPPETSAADRAALQAALGDEAAATDDNEAAAAAYRMALDLMTGDGAARAAAALVPRLVAAAHLLGEPLDARVAALRAALDRLDGVPAAARERARLQSAIAAAYMLDRRLDEAIVHGDEGRAGSLRAGDDEGELDAATTHGSVLVFAGRMDDGWHLLAGAITRAVAERQEAAAARAYRMLGTSASVLVEYDRAEAVLAAGIGYAEQAELANHRHYMAAHLAHVQWATGQWEIASAGAAQVLADGHGGITTRITAGYVLGYLALGRRDPVAEKLLQDAYADGLAMAELQRFSPPLWGLAESAWCRGDLDDAIDRCERGYAASAAVRDAAYLFPYLLTGVRAHLGRDDVDAAAAWLDRVAGVLATRSIPGTLPAIDHGRGLILAARGEIGAAQARFDIADAAWRTRRRFWEGTWLQLDRAALALKARRRGAATAYIGAARDSALAAGATVIVDAADRLATAAGGGRPAEPWDPLSAREFEVARLIALGMTNRQIAERLVLAPKTIAAHVEHILTKLGAARRTEIAAWCATVPTERPLSAL